MSAPVSAVVTGFQAGVEVTEAVAVAANKKFSSIGIRLSPSIETTGYAPMGYLFDTMEAVGKDWAEGPIDGRLSFTEIVYILATMFPFSAPTQIGTTGAYTWVFSPAVSAVDTTKTLTVEWGHPGSGNARKAAGVFANELGFAFSRDGIEVSGTAIGRNVTKGVTLTSSPTALSFIPTLPTQFSVYMDSTWAGLGTTKLLDVTAADFTLGDRFSPFWTLNAALASFAAKVQNKPSADLSLRMAANATGYGYLDALRAQTTKFIRIEAIGANIGTNADYRFALDVAAQYNAAAEEEEDEGALMLQPPMTIVADPTSGKALEITVVNMLSTL